MTLLKGALVEYGTDLLGPLKNVLIFQFNPATLTRSLQISNPSPESDSEETVGQIATPPRETITFTAHFNASDKLNNNNIVARALGIDPQLAAMENMVAPKNDLIAFISDVIDKIGGSLDDEENPEEPIPRLQAPRILFIWGLTKLLPVQIESMSITEEQYDVLLNPIQAKVDITLSVKHESELSDDAFAQGALSWSNMAKNGKVIANLANTAEEIVDLITFR